MNSKYIKGAVLLGVILSVGLSSCNITKKYKAPEIDTLDLYRDQYSEDTTTIANIPWREYFKDPVLQSLIDEGLNNNFDMLITAQRVYQAEASLGMAKAAYFPTVALTGNVTQNRTSNRDPLTNEMKGEKVLGYHSETYFLGIAATWEADIWGKLTRQKKAKYAQLLNSYAGRNLVQTSLISNIATTYYTLLSLDEQLAVTKETIALLEENVTTMQALFDAGNTNSAGLEQTKAMLYSTQVSVPALESQIKQLENAISMMLGRKPGPITRLSISEQTVPQEMKIGVPVQMLAKRPDVQQAELTFRASFELTQAARASFYPSITLDAGSMVGYGWASLSSFFDPGHLAANIIGSITQPIFARKQLTGNLKIAKAEQEASLLSFKKAVLSASQEVSDILYTYESSLTKNDIRNKQVEASKKAVGDTQELLKYGEATYIEVLTAQQNLLQAQLGQVNDKLEQLQASVNLYRALGGGTE